MNGKPWKCLLRKINSILAFSVPTILSLQLRTAMIKEKLRVFRLHFWKQKQEFQEEPTPAQQPKVGEGFGPGDDFVGNSIRKNPASKPKPIKNAGRWIKFYKTRRSVVYICVNIFFTLLPKGKRSSPFRIFGKSCICPKQAGFGCWKKFQLFPKIRNGGLPRKSISKNFKHLLSPLSAGNM